MQIQISEDKALQIPQEPCEKEIIYMGTYQSGVDGQLFVWIDQQKYMPNVSLQQRGEKNTSQRNLTV